MSFMRCSNEDVRHLPPGGVLWALMDCNNFYASCERLFRPDLVKKPIVVLSNNDGCVIARSDEAKALGVPMGAPEFKVRHMLRHLGVAVFSSNYALYGDLSQRIMRVLGTVVPEVDVYSIDEAFAPLPPALASDPAGVGQAMRRRVAEWVGMPISVGIASTRTLAKLANRIAKRDPKHDGVFDMTHPAVDVDALLESVPVAHVWGIGNRQAERLRGRGILTARALRDADSLWVRQRLTISGWRTQQELRGIPCLATDDLPEARRSIRSSRSFARPVRDLAALREAVSTFAARAAEKARREGLVAARLEVHIRTSAHGQGLRCDDSVALSLPEICADTAMCIHYAQKGLERIFRPGYPYAKAGVLLYGLEPAYGRQGNLLSLLDGNAERTAARERLMSTMDAVNVRYGRGSLRHAAEGVADADWHMRQNHLSPRYTTAWKELPKLLCR